MSLMSLTYLAAAAGFACAILVAYLYKAELAATFGWQNGWRAKLRRDVRALEASFATEERLVAHVEKLMGHKPDLEKLRRSVVLGREAIQRLKQFVE